MIDPAIVCGLCGDPVEGEALLCSACGFAAERFRSLGLAVVPAGVGGTCSNCLHAPVCRVLDAASEVGAIISACPAHLSDAGANEKPSAKPEEEEDDRGHRELERRCKERCPHHEGEGPLEQCAPQTITQRLSYCGTIRQWSTEIEEI